MFGITLDNIDAPMAPLKAAIRALPFRPMARVVVDNGRDLDDYNAPVRELRQVADIMLLVQDSYGEHTLSTAQYVAKCQYLMGMLGQVVNLWEIGNEVNGSWVSKDIWRKVTACQALAKTRGFQTAVTFWWDKALWNWLIDKPRLGIDWAMLSCYPTRPSELSTMVAALDTGVPQKQILAATGAKDWAIGEYGEDEWARAGASARKLLVRSFEKYRYGGFYWGFQKQCVPKHKVLHGAVSAAWRDRR